MWTPDRTKDIITAEQREAEAQQAAWNTLRADRDNRLAATDWVILRNLETSEPVPTEWLEYRAALRDLPGNTDDPARPDWPSPPTIP